MVDVTDASKTRAADQPGRDERRADKGPARRSNVERRLLQQAAVAKPLREAFWPTGGGTGFGVVPVAKTVPGVGEDVQLGGDFRGLVFQIHGGQAFGDIGAV